MGPNGQQGVYPQVPAIPAPVEPATTKRSSFGKIAILIVVAVVIAGGSFYAGIVYEKGHQGTAPGRFGGGGGGETVNAISGSSITVKNSRTGDSNTYTITSSTTVTDNGNSSSVSAIKDGDTVLVRTSGSGSTTASQIIVNPNFGGGAGGDRPSSSPQP